MIDFENYSIKNRKLELLSCLKTAFESFLFDRSNASFGCFNFSVNFNLFCQYIKEILIDEIKAPNEEKKCEFFWVLVISILLDESEREKISPAADFYCIYRSLNSKIPDHCLSDWISNSLRNKTFLKQLNHILQFDIKNNYQNTAFILDEQFLKDFLLYIQAYENNDSRLLNNCKLDQLISINSHVESKNGSERTISDRFLTNCLPIDSKFESNSNKKNHNTHRRIHSYPFIKQNTLKKNEKNEKNVSTDIQCVESKNSENKEDFVEIATDQESLISSIECSTRIDNQFDSKNNISVMDFINQLHLHSECSSLDKENAHFLMADLVITSNELSKSENLLDNSIKKTSSPIKISKNQSKQQYEKMSRSRSLSKSLNTCKSISQRSYSFSELYSFNENIISEIVSKFKGFRINESGISIQNDSSLINSSLSQSKLLDSFSNTPISTNCSISFDQPQITQEGFDYIQEVKSSRIRKFSWENQDMYDSASFIAFKLIKTVLNTTNLKAPSLKLFEYFLKNLEFNEIMRDYFIHVSSTKMRKDSSDNLSASSIFLSHNDFNLKRYKPDGLSAESFVLIDSENNLSSYSKIKDIALNTFAKQDQTIMDNSINLSSSRIIGDESWAPVREQLIIKKATKIPRIDLIKNQNYRCADCGLRIKDKAKQLKSFNYCEYFCKYFCRYCHINETSYIPAEVIFSLNFKIDFQVSRKAKNFLTSIYKEPVFSLENLNPSLFQGKYSFFTKVKNLRVKLYISIQYINTCRYADKIKNEIETKFQNEKFIFESTEVYSFYLMFKLKKSYFIENLQTFSQKVICHIKTCKLCSQRSHICEICRKNELIYPFDIETIEKCAGCFSCYHKKCFNKIKECPKCIRLKLRALK